MREERVRLAVSSRGIKFRVGLNCVGLSLAWD